MKKIDSSLLLRYILTLFLSHLVFGSIFLFFHLLLEHKHAVIENWFFENSWQYILLVKMFSFSMICLFSIERNIIKDLVVSFQKAKAHVGIAVLVFASMSLLFYNLRPERSVHAYFPVNNLLLSYFGNIVLIVVDLIIVKLAIRNNPVKFIVYMLLGLMFFLINTLLLTDMVHVSSMYLLGFVFSFYLISQEELGIKNALFYLVFFVSPIIIIFGQDAVWGESISPFIVKEQLSLEHFFIILFLSLYYLEWKTGKIQFFRRNRAK